MDLWAALLDVLILLLAALLLGALCERLRQSAILGYLLAGTLLGPNALDLMPSHKAVAAIAELGVALLLFTIGLEFSWRRLRSIGAIALGGGTAQVLLTGILGVGGWEVNGVALAGLYLKAEDYFKGFGTGAYTNIGEQRGVTIGLLNTADELHGLQIGILNWAGNNRTPFKLLPLINYHGK